MRHNSTMRTLAVLVYVSQSGIITVMRSFLSLLGALAEGAVALAIYAWLAACVVGVAVAAVLAAILGGWLGAVGAVVFGGMVVLFVGGVVRALHDGVTLWRRRVNRSGPALAVHEPRDRAARHESITSGRLSK